MQDGDASRRLDNIRPPSQFPSPTNQTRDSEYTPRIEGTRMHLRYLSIRFPYEKKHLGVKVIVLATGVKYRVLSAALSCIQYVFDVAQSENEVIF